MELTVAEDPDATGPAVADLIEAAVAAEPGLVLGVATGSSPLPTYRALRSRSHGQADLAGLRIVALDEYLDLAPTHPASYHAYVERELARPLGLPPDRVLLPDGLAPNPDREASGFEQTIAALGGVDLQLLGIGRNGHLGFNEPPASLGSRTRVVRLSATTRADNARFFDDPGEVPTHCLTQGLATILESRRLVLVATGPEKASAVAAALEGPVTEWCPASALQLHPRVTVVLDRAAASALSPGLRDRAATPPPAG